MNQLIQTPSLVFINIFLILILFLLSRPAYRNFKLSTARRCIVIIIVLVFCLFSFWGKDWFGYLEYFEEIQQGYKVKAMEPIYNYVGECCSNYIMFRFLIWGSALFLFYKTITTLPINKDVALFFFCSIFLIWFSYARASLAMATMFYGYAKLATAEHRFGMRWLLGVILICISFFLHKSSIIAILALFISEVLRLFNKKHVIWFLLFLFPMGVYILTSRFTGIVDILVGDEGSMLNEYAVSGNKYLESDIRNAGIGTYIQSFLETLPYYLLALMSIKALSRYRQSIPHSIQLFMVVLVLLILIASLFAFDLGLNTSAVYVRMMRYLQIPSCVLLTYLHTHQYFPKLTHYTCIIYIASTLYSLVYVMYNSYMALYAF